MLPGNVLGKEMGRWKKIKKSPTFFFLRTKKPKKKITEKVKKIWENGKALSYASVCTLRLEKLRLGIWWLGALTVQESTPNKDSLFLNDCSEDFYLGDFYPWLCQTYKAWEDNAEGQGLLCLSSLPPVSQRALGHHQSGRTDHLLSNEEISAHLFMASWKTRVLMILSTSLRR